MFQAFLASIISFGTFYMDKVWKAEALQAEMDVKNKG
jgi:hypothetical protein